MNKLLIVTTITPTLRAFFAPLARHLREIGWQVDGMAKGVSTCPECLQAFDRTWEIDWSRNPTAPQNLLVAPPQIREVLAQQAYNLVNVSTPVAAFVSRYVLNDLRKQGKLKVIYTAQGFHFYKGGSPLKNSIFLGLEKLAGPWTDCLVVVNREDKEAAKRWLVPAERVRYIPGTGLNVDRYNPLEIPEAEILRVRQELGLSPDTPLFLSVAELIPRKRPHDVLKAFARLRRPEAHLAFAGQGQIKEMQQLASQLGVENQVHFLGFRRDIPVLMRASAATVLASEHEGLPNCVMESLCLEVPAIGTDIRGTRDLLEGGCGLLVKLGDIDGLAQAMAWVLDRPVAAREMAQRGRKSILAYELQNILKQYEALYAEINNQQLTINQ